MSEKGATDEQLAEEANLWDTRQLTPAGWQDSADAVPRASESTQINMRLPREIVTILKELANRLGIGYTGRDGR